MSDLERLIEAVEAGDDKKAMALAYPVFGDKPATGLVLTVIVKNSLDAAHRLHEALLPGWPFPNTTTTTEVVIFGVALPGQSGATGWSKVPARAWLLAILRALQATTETEGK